MTFYPRNTRALTNQNEATTQWRNGPVPSMPGYGDPYDKPFDEMYTPEDQVHWLYTHLMRGPQDEDTSNLQEQIDLLNSRVTALEKQMQTLQATVQTMVESINSIATGTMAYDVTAGNYAPTRAAARRAWQAATPWGMTVEDLAQYTVQEISGWGVLAVATVGKFLYMYPDAECEMLTAQVICEQLGETYPQFDPSGYLRREELEQIDVDNLQAGTIYGVLDTSLPTDVGVLAPWKRKATVSDLNTSMISYNGHFVTKEA